MFENTILRQIFWPERDENFKWLHNEELHGLYRSPNTVRVIKPRRSRWAVYVARMKRGRTAFTTLTSKPTGRRSLGRPRRRWEGNIRINLKKISIITKNWIYPTQDRDNCRALVNAGLNLRVL